MAEGPPEVGQPDPTQIVGLLASDDRLKVAAALALGAATPREVAEAAGLEVARAARALERLTAGGLAERGAGGGYRLRAEVFRQAARAAAPLAAPDEAPAWDGQDRRRQAILRTFIREGRLAQIPASHAKRLVVLDYLAQLFEPGRRFAEAEINAGLKLVDPDSAALRRYLVEEASWSGARVCTGGPGAPST